MFQHFGLMNLECDHLLDHSSGFQESKMDSAVQSSRSNDLLLAVKCRNDMLGVISKLPVFGATNYDALVCLVILVELVYTLFGTSNSVCSSTRNSQI